MDIGAYQEQLTAWRRVAQLLIQANEKQLAASIMDPQVSLQNGSDMPSEHDPTSQKTSHRDESDIEQHEVDYDELVSPLHMPPGQIDSLEALRVETFANDHAHSPSRRRSVIGARFASVSLELPLRHNWHSLPCSIYHTR